MMLKTSLPGTGRHPALAGAVFGAFLPAACLAAHHILSTYAGADTLGFSASAATALALAPVFGMGFYRLGRQRALLLAELRRRRKREERLVRGLYHDRLTGLANRFCLERDIRDLLRAGAAESRPALLLLDLDRFKAVNDSLGHDAGDQLLAALAARLTQALRTTGKVYRLGGDEFVVTIPGAPSIGKVEDACRAIRALLAEPFELRQARIASGCSIGVTFLETGDATMSELVKRADIALYAAKGAPGGVRFFDAALAAENAARTALAGDIARGLPAGEFFLEYQPIVGIESRAVRAFEALLRWRHPERGVLLPGAFLPIAEKAGLIRPLGNWALREACRVAAGWPAPTGIAVNVAGDQLRDRAFVDHVAECLGESGLAPGRLTVEVREAVFLADAVVRETLGALGARGVRIVLEGFGAGPSAIESLRALPVDGLKIDRALARTMAENARDGDLTGILLRLARAFQMTATVVGIETEGQLDFLRQHGTCEVQGDLICPPVSATDASALLAQAENRLSA